MRVLHILHTSLPYVCGYTIRSGQILEGQRAEGHLPAAVTSARHLAGALREDIDGVPHFRTPPVDERPPVLREIRLMTAVARSVDAAVSAFGPDLLHAHSPVLVGLPALLVARRRGLPFVYEVRDFWENASVDLGKFEDGSPRYLAARAAETWVLGRADAVVTLCASLRDEIATRLGRNDRISIVDNGVDLARFFPRPPRDDLRARYGLVGKKVIGYAGAFLPYEGLDILIAAVPRIAACVPEVRVFLAGAGREEHRLRALAAALGLGDRVIFAGHVPPADVPDIYPLFDVAAYPRVLTRTTAHTTPLKPLEAMAMARPILVSDLPALCEIVRPGETGNVFRAGDTESLAERCIEILEDPAWQRVLGQRARAWVERERRWPDLVARYAAIYEVASSWQRARAPSRRRARPGRPGRAPESAWAGGRPAVDPAGRGGFGD